MRGQSQEKGAGQLGLEPRIAGFGDWCFLFGFGSGRRKTRLGIVRGNARGNETRMKIQRRDLPVELRLLDRQD